VAEIRTIAVIGAGALGREIALAAARAGYRTILQDILPDRLRSAQAELGESRSTRLEYASTVEEAARQADLVIEAVPDELESKLEIFTLLDKVCRPQTILVSNTSSLSITEIASITYRPQKCIAIKFVNGRAELVRGEQTDQETVKACEEVIRRIGSSGQKTY